MVFGVGCLGASHDGLGDAGACETPSEEDDDPSHLFGQDSAPLGIPDGGPQDDGGPPGIGDGGGISGPTGGSGAAAEDVPKGPVLNPFGDADTLEHGVNALSRVSIAAAFATTVKLGTNARVCETCHSVTSGWTTRVSDIARAFNQTNDKGALDPIFMPNDGSNNPNADLSTPAARKVAYSMLLTRGVIRVSLPIPSDAQFSLATVDDPYAYASAQALSLFRRVPLMANLRFSTDLMWDGRQTQACQTLQTMLESQANDAAKTHAQASADLPQDTLRQLAARERTIYFAQQHDNRAGDLDADGAIGGTRALPSLPFYAGINAFPGPDPRGKVFDPRAFTLYDAWINNSSTTEQGAARAAIARGQEIFNSRKFTIKGVKGLNDHLDVASIIGTCTSCHNTPNIGNNSTGMRFDIGISDGTRRSAQSPLYTLRNKATGETIQTTDPGRALVSGAWSDIGRFRVPSLRGLANRAPYFHDGSAATIGDVVDFEDARFGIGLTDADKADLVAFLAAL